MHLQTIPTESREVEPQTTSTESHELRVRPIQPEDLGALTALLPRIPQFKPEEIAVAQSLIEASIESSLSSGYESLVAAEGSALLGYVSFSATPMTQATWDLYWIAVAPEAQGRGVGKRLLEHLLSTLRARGGRNVRIETSSQESYRAASAFYLRSGFQIEGRLRDFYSPGDDLLIYYLSLD